MNHLEKENRRFLTEQIITYLGNKRSLLKYIDHEIHGIRHKLGREKLVAVDLFSGSGIVARMMKQHSKHLIVNDLEAYSRVLNACYLSNREDFDPLLYHECREAVQQRIHQQDFSAGLVTTHYAPKDDQRIQPGERVFYTTRNALLIDTIREEIDKMPASHQKYFMAPLLYEASVKTNTAGVFKGFYKDSRTGIGKFGGTGAYALQRIKGEIKVLKPVLSDHACQVTICQEDANELVKQLSPVDVVYIDPPYNQHPYGSNYFMLNLILENRLDAEISRVSGIPRNWRRSDYNVRGRVLDALEQVVADLSSRFLIISYNSEGFISYEQMHRMLSRYGKLATREILYNTYRGSRNLNGRNLYVQEYLFILDKQ